MKKNIAFVLSLIFLLSLLGGFGAQLLTAVAADHSGVHVPAPEGFIEIYTAQDLRSIDRNLSGNYILMNDIDLSSWGNWEPIGNGKSPFNGTFNGNGYVIKNLTVQLIDEGSLAGLFGYSISATIENVGIFNAKVEVIRSGACVGSLIGACDFTTIRNCYSNNSTISVTSSWGDSNAGGLIGKVSSNCVIENCHNSSSVYSICNSDVSDRAWAGGIAGFTFSPISNCSNAGEIIAEVNVYFTTANAGGIAGGTFTNCTISQCFNQGTVNAIAESKQQYYTSTTHAGGIVADTIAPVTNCYNIGTIIAETSSGADYSATTIAAFSGGIIGIYGGVVDNVVIAENCYNFGEIKSSAISTTKNKTASKIAGFSGNIIAILNNERNIGINNCYYINVTSHDVEAENRNDYTAKGLSASQTQQQSSFVGFDFNAIWKMGESNYPYPILRNITTNATSTGCKNGHTYKSANGNKCTVCGYEFTPELKDVNKTFYAVKANVPVWSSPYSKSGTVVRQMKADESIYITKSMINSVGNLWYLTQDGKYIYSENLTDKKPANAKSYNISSALSYAKNNYSTSSEKCAGFVSKCLAAGGFNIMNRVASDLYWTLKDQGFESYALTPNGNYYYISEENNSKAKVGDVIIYYCNACTGKNYKHAVIITEIDSKGIIHATGTNSRWNNEINCATYYTSCGHGKANGGNFTVYLLHWPY